MRASRYLIATQKEIPADAEVVSHQLMLRAGMIRKLAAGLYSWLPLGLRVLQKAERIVREEMNRAGAQEVLMPVVQPAELWQDSGRWDQYGPELLRFSDRHKRDFCLGPTHEEVITELARNEIKSYKQLPINFYQIQTKFRDEIRPRFGIMRAREFLMKDAYSFHLGQESLQQTYRDMFDAYAAIFTRLELDFRAVVADTGSIGGSRSHEFHVLADSGEDAIAFSTESDYASNVEMSEALAPAEPREPPSSEKTEVATPDVHTIDEVCKFLDVGAERTAKTLIVEGDSEEQPLIALVVRGDRELNVVKAEKISGVRAPLQFADEKRIREVLGCGVGSLGPVGLPIPVVADHGAAQLSDFVCGANRDGFHLTGVNWERDCPLATVADIRNVVTGDPSPDGRGTLVIRRGIEVGHIFQLGTKYSAAMNATVLGEDGKEHTMIMGCYGIGVSRVVAAAIEQNHDERGIIWPDVLAPFQIALVPINMHKSDAVRSTCEDLYRRLTEKGCEVLFMDEEKARLGAMLADIELMGIPHRLMVGERGLANGTVEYRHRRADDNADLPIDRLEAFFLDNIPSGS